MAKVILSVLLIVCLRSGGVLSKPVDDVSYIEGVNFEYKNDKWICGDVECPANTFGCKIVLKTNKDDRKVLYQTFNCIDEDKHVTLGAGDKIDLPKDKVIDIELETYVGAESVYGTGYGLGGNERAKGVVALNDLPGLKESARHNKKIVDDSNF